MCLCIAWRLSSGVLSSESEPKSPHPWASGTQSTLFLKRTLVVVRSPEDRVQAPALQALSEG